MSWLVLFLKYVSYQSEVHVYCISGFRHAPFIIVYMLATNRLFCECINKHYLLYCIVEAEETQNPGLGWFAQAPSCWLHMYLGHIGG